jgi:hypothetical protein
MAARKGGESKQGLIITLVFFILATIGLGVSTYFGFAEQEKLTGEKKEAEKKLKTITDDREWARAQGNFFRAIMGQIGSVPADKIGIDKAAFDDGKMGSGQPDRGDVESLFKDLEKKKIAWPKGKNLPDVTYEKLVADERKAVEEVRKRNTTLEAEVARLKKGKDDTEAELAEAKKNFDAELAKAKKKSEDDLSSYVQIIAQLRNQLDAQGKTKEDLVKKADEEKATFLKEKQKSDKNQREMREYIKAKEDELNLVKAKTGTTAPKDWRNDWRVLSVGRYGQEVYINLGSADKLQPQLTFSVHGVDQSGRPLQESKGSLEVMDILGDHLARARLTGVKDPNRDPVVPRDVLYNPTWSPTLKKHVAIAGIIDLTGDGRDNIQEFLRNLERQNVIIDAYLDLRDLTIRGKGMNVRTEYLILGDGAEIFGENRERESKEFIDKLSKGMGEMQDQATRYGVTVIGLRKYLEQIGYRLPKVTGGREAGSGYRPRVGSSGGEPNGKPEPAKKEKDKDKKPEKEM